MVLKWDAISGGFAQRFSPVEKTHRERNPSNTDHSPPEDPQQILRHNRSRATQQRSRLFRKGGSGFPDYPADSEADTF